MKGRRVLLLIIILLSLPLFSQNKINHQNDVWYQLLCVPIEDEKEPYTLEWIWRNPTWKDVIGFVDPKNMVQGSFKMSDFVLMNPSSRMGIEVREALSIFENDELTSDGTHSAGGVNYYIKKNGVIWQPDKTFLLILTKMEGFPESVNDSGYEWW